ncbi:MAG: hypothetical protein HKL90_16470 [Elusimicrobia bacterium]|nr:hypothetical protein [Elusimicrobiota bacterium]
MKCPSCAAECAEGALECASCGVIFAKLEARRRREREEVEQALAKLGADSAPVVDPMLGRAVAMVAFALWAGVMSYFVVQQMRRRPAPRPAAPERAVAAPAVVPTLSTAPAAPAAASLLQSSSTAAVTPAPDAHQNPQETQDPRRHPRVLEEPLRLRGSDGPAQGQ